MRDINLPIRSSFYNLLNGKLFYENSHVPIADEQLKKYDTNNFYVILSSQSSSPDSTKQGWERRVSIVLDIVTKTNNSVSKDIADNIASQIFTLLSTTPHTHNLPVPSDFQFLEVQLSDDRYLSLSITPTQLLMRRLLTFELRVTY